MIPCAFLIQEFMTASFVSVFSYSDSRKGSFDEQG